MLALQALALDRALQTLPRKSRVRNRMDGRRQLMKEWHVKFDDEWVVIVEAADIFQAIINACDERKFSSNSVIRVSLNGL